MGHSYGRDDGSTEHKTVKLRFLCARDTNTLTPSDLSINSNFFNISLTYGNSIYWNLTCIHFCDCCPSVTYDVTFLRQRWWRSIKTSNASLYAHVIATTPLTAQTSASSPFPQKHILIQNNEMQIRRKNNNYYNNITRPEIRMYLS